jgi:hypothetical protein
MIPVEVKANIALQGLEMLRRDRQQAQQHLGQLGIKEESAFGQFFLEYEGGFSIGPKHKDMLDVVGPAYPSIGDATSFIHRAYGVPQNFICITSPEGEGFVLYDKRTESVYDTGLDELPALLSGDLQPRWQTFFDYLRDYFSEIRRPAVP